MDREKEWAGDGGLKGNQRSWVAKTIGFHVHAKCKCKHSEIPIESRVDALAKFCPKVFQILNSSMLFCTLEDDLGRCC
jgi:hypothetical protein